MTESNDPATTGSSNRTTDTEDSTTETTDSTTETTLTHTDAEGSVEMVDVGDKPPSDRRAVARGTIYLQPATIEAIEENEIEKGDVLATARIGAVQAVKHTWETIPMCHQIPITNVDTTIDRGDDHVQMEVAVETTGQTGCEMEALEGVTTGLNVIWDMVKATEKDEDGQYPDTRITDVEVIQKRKDPSGQKPV